jgi:hypothetical protein
MNAMSTDQWSIFVAAMILGAPLVLMAGPIIRNMALCLLWLAIFASHPVIGLLIGVVIVLHRPLRWFIEAIFAGFGAGLGLRAAGFAQRLSMPVRALRSRHWTRSAPRSRGRRPQDYMPFDDPLDGRSEADAPAERRVGD